MFFDFESTIPKLYLLGYIKCTQDVATVGSFLVVVLDQYVMGGWAKKLPPKTQNSFIVASLDWGIDGD